jgi:hypothetical protein
MTFAQAIAKSKIRLLIVSFNVCDSDNLSLSRNQTRELFKELLDVTDEFEEGTFQDNNIFARLDGGILYLG